MTLQKVWNARKPSATHLKVFGSITYMHVDDQVKTKLDDKSKKMIFVDNDQKSKWYKLYNSNKKKRWWLVRMLNLIKKEHGIRR